MHVQYTHGVPELLRQSLGKHFMGQNKTFSPVKRGSRNQTPPSYNSMEVSEKLVGKA